MMEVIVNANYGTVLVSNDIAYYVPTKKPPRGVRWPAATEKRPDLKRSSVASIDAVAGETVSLTLDDFNRIDGVVPFSGDRPHAIARASDWAQIEELVGPLRYRQDVESAAMYWVSGDGRPRIPLRVAAHGSGAIGIYLSAHGHRLWAISKALNLTYAQLLEHKYRDVYVQTPSFEWEGYNYE